MQARTHARTSLHACATPAGQRVAAENGGGAEYGGAAGKREGGAGCGAGIDEAYLSNHLPKGNFGFGG